MRFYNEGSSLDLTRDLYGSKRIAYTLIVIAFYFLTISEFLPFISSINARIIYSIKLMMLVLFFLGVLSIKPNLCLRYVAIFVLAIFFNIYMHHQSFYRYDISIMFVLTRSSMCWLYMLMGLFLTQFECRKLKKQLRRISAVLICVTSVTTIIGLQKYPEASRSIGNGVKLQDIDTISLYRMNVAPWGLIFAITISLTFWLFEYRKTKKKTYLLVSILATVCVLESQLTFAILFAAFIWVSVVFFYKMNNIKVLVVTFVILIAGLLLFINRVEIMLSLSNLFASIGSQTLQRRFYQLYISFLYGEWFGDSKVRFELYYMSLQTFFENPIKGYRVRPSDLEFTKIGMHSTLFDMLGATGIIGGLSIIPSFVFVTKGIKQRIDDNHFWVFAITMGLVVLLNIINPTYKSPQIYYAAFIIPLLYDERTLIAKSKR